MEKKNRRKNWKNLTELGFVETFWNILKTCKTAIGMTSDYLCRKDEFPKALREKEEERKKCIKRTPVIIMRVKEGIRT